MNRIIGKYKIPAIKQVFFIVSDPSIFDDLDPSFKEKKVRIDYFQKILSEKEVPLKKLDQQWTVKILSQLDFLTALKRHSPHENVFPKLSFHNPESLELFTLTPVNTQNNDSCSYHSSKQLGCIAEDDIIEIYI